MNWGLIVIDYLMQTKEQTGKFDVEAAKKMLEKGAGSLLTDEYHATLDLIDRIAKERE